MDLAVLLPIAQAADPTDGLKAIALGVGPASRYMLAGAPPL